VEPMRLLPPNWEPSITLKRVLHREYGKEVDLGLILQKFKAFHSEGQTSRDWDSKFHVWVITDVQRVRERTRGGTDDLGNPLTQQRYNPRPLGPGDAGYVSLDDLAETARAQARGQQR
jgi:hypothetical protein